MKIEFYNYKHTTMTTPPNIDNLVPPNLAKRFGFFSLTHIMDQFKDVSLHEMIRVNSTTTFVPNCNKYCYRMDYKTLTLTVLDALDNHTESVVAKYSESYVKQPMHSISGEQQDICFYTYGPQDLVQFLEQNKNNHYTFLPMTVHATESANGYRHDMLVIFDNKTKLFYWFDGRNREDYFPFGSNIPKNVIDALLINLSDKVKTGYSYEASPSWVISSVLQPFASIGQFDFVMSTAWCYLVMSMLENFESPTAMLSALDTLSKEDRFHLLYTSLLHMIGVYNYHKTVPQNAQVNFVEEKVEIVNNKPRTGMSPSSTISQPDRPNSIQVSEETKDVHQEVSLTREPSTANSTTESEPNEYDGVRKRLLHKPVSDYEMAPMPIVSSNENSKKKTSSTDKGRDGCLLM